MTETTNDNRASRPFPPGAAKEFFTLGTIAAACTVICACAGLGAIESKDYLWGTVLSAAAVGSGAGTYLLVWAGRFINRETRNSQPKSLQ